MAISVILTGTGYPRPDPNRAGPGALAIADGIHLQFDCGRGTVMRLAALGLLPAQLDALLFTHFHSDHIIDLADILMSRWLLSSPPAALALAGPTGLAQLARDVRGALAADIARRQEHSGKREPMELDVREFVRPARGIVEAFATGGVRVLAGPVDHGNVTHAVGYRVECGSHAIAISGDMTECEGLVELAKDADVLVQEVLHPGLLEERFGAGSRYIVNYHTTPEAAGRMARKAGVKKLVLTHIIPFPRDEADEWAFVDAAAKEFKGEIVAGRDLMRFDV